MLHDTTHTTPSGPIATSNQFMMRAVKTKESDQSWKSGRTFRVGFMLKVDKILGSFVAWDVLIKILGNFAKFFRPKLTFVFFGHGLGFILVFGFGPELIGPFTTLSRTPNPKDLGSIHFPIAYFARE